MNQENQLYTKDELNTRIKFLNELIDGKTSQLEMMNDALKKVEIFSAGSKDIGNKVDEFIRVQKKELNELVIQGKLSEEIKNFTDSVINIIQIFSKKSSEENEKLHFIRQGEFIFLSQEIERLTSLKKNHEVALEKMNQNEVKKTFEDVHTEIEKDVKKEKKIRIRPDKDPNTVLGRTSMRLVEARRKSIELSSTSFENVSKKKQKGN